jgi:hypothetical protein
MVISSLHTTSQRRNIIREIKPSFIDNGAAPAYQHLFEPITAALIYIFSRRFIHRGCLM